MYSAVVETGRGGVYGRLADDYDRLHGRWLRFAGGEAQAALEATVRVLSGPNTRILDAGCGTGMFARKLIAEGMPPENITLLDSSREMLARCADIPTYKVHGSIEDLPFEDGSFDIVTSAWALETVAEPETAVGELCRITKIGGVLCLAFCAETETPTFVDWIASIALSLRGLGSLLDVQSVMQTVAGSNGFQVQRLPCNGPAAVLVARRI